MRIGRRYRCCHLRRCFIVLICCVSISIIAMSAILPYMSITQSYEFTKVFVVDETDINDAQIKPTSDLQLLHKDYFNATYLTCRYPILTIDNPEVWKHLNPVKQSKPDCGNIPNWVYVENGTLRLSQQALRKHGSIMCSYHPILRSNDFSSTDGDRIFPVRDKMSLTSDFFRIDCQAKDGSNYSNFHMGLKFDPLLHTRSIQTPMTKTHLGYNILIVGFDSVSRMTFMRFLPKAYLYLIKELGAIVMKGYNIVGDATTAALFPILTGKTERELPEARHDYACADVIDEFPWIWKQFKDNGYVTQWAEDMPSIGTFQLRLKGFRNPPVDHYGRPFYLYVESKTTSKPLCFGSITRLQAMFDWTHDFFDMYPHQPKFSYLFHADYSHNSNDRLPYADNELLGFLQMMHTQGYLDHTMLIIKADHGARFESLRKTRQGRLEERLPFMSIRMPPKFQAEYPTIMKNLRLNSHRLTTPFDIHETFEHLFEFHSGNSYKSKSKRSFSLFELVPRNRTCAQSEVKQHWCTCHAWYDVSVNESIIQQYSQAVVEFLNNFISDHKHECAKLTLLRVNKASQLKNENTNSLQVQNSSMQVTNGTKFYQIQFETTPGQAQFEVTAEYNPNTKTFDIQKRHLSRMNRYGETSACIARKRPELREICYCLTVLVNTNISTVVPL